MGDVFVISAIINITVNNLPLVTISSPANLTSELLGKVDSLGIVWFQEMVGDNLEEALEFVEKNNPVVAENLHSLLGVK